MKLITIDFETTGLDPSTAYPVQLGLVVEDRGFDLPIRAPVWALLRPAFWKAKKIHKRTLREMLLEGMPPKRVVKIVDAIHDGHPDYVIAGHNVGFDAAFLNRLYRLAGKKRHPWGYHYVDLATLGIVVLGERKLHHIAAELQVDMKAVERHTGKTAHDALYDAALTAECLDAILARIKPA